MKRAIVYILYIVLALFNCRLHAEGNRYQVELVVFEQGVQSSTVSNQTESRIQWPTALTELSGIQQTDQKSLKDGVAVLLKNPAYRLIIHRAWVQSAGPGGVILPMHISSNDGRLDGFIHLRNGQPYELIVDLEQQVLSANNISQRYLYRMNEKRMVKLNEINYFDHPKIGVIVLIVGI